MKLFKAVTILAILFMVNLSVMAQSEKKLSLNSRTRYHVTHKKNILYDVYGNRINISKVPLRIVCLAPDISDLINKISPEYRLAGATLSDAWLNISKDAVFVGGRGKPDPQLIEKCRPEIIIALPEQMTIINKMNLSGKTRVLVFDPVNIKDIYSNITIIGRIFHKEQNARDVINEIKGRISVIQRKISLIPENRRLKVTQIENFEGGCLKVPGKKTFQNEAIRLAGGIPIPLKGTNRKERLTSSQWNSFNPDVVYSSDWSRTWKKIVKSGKWNRVSAVKNRKHLSIAGFITGGSTIYYGHLIEYLAASLYGKSHFSKKSLIKDGYTETKKLNIDLNYVDSAEIRTGTIRDFEQKTLIIKLNKKMDVLSTLRGFKNVNVIGNHYTSPPREKVFDHMKTVTVEILTKEICNAVDEKYENSSFLMTGVYMDNLAVVHKQYKKMKVCVIATAGVRGNAQRQSVDTGIYYPFGTINIIVLSNAEMSHGAMARAIISATEAKTAALQDLDIRSSYTPMRQATGTGTDEVMVVQGTGQKIQLGGGHTKIGELISKAVYEAVKKTLLKQNKIKVPRTVYERLCERKLWPWKLADCAVKNKAVKIDREVIQNRIERELVNERTISLIESAFALNDSFMRGQLKDFSFFKKMSLSYSGKISGKSVKKLIKVEELKEDTPLNFALKALITGVSKK